MSWSRPKQCYSIIPSVTALQAHKNKDTLFGSLPCLTVPPSTLCVTTKHTVLTVNKYSLSFRIINTVLVKSSLKDATEYLSEHQYKTNNCTVRRFSFSICVSDVFILLLFGFSIKAQNLERRRIRRSPSGDLPVPTGPNVDTNNTHTGTLTDKQYCRAI